MIEPLRIAHFLHADIKLIMCSTSKAVSVFKTCNTALGNQGLWEVHFCVGSIN